MPDHPHPEGSSPADTEGAPTAAPFTYSRDARSVTAMLAISAWLLGLAVLWLVLGTVVWILLLLLLPVLPALWELVKNPTSTLLLDQSRLTWSSPRSQADIALAEIDHVMMTTRWDFSIRTTVHTRIGTHHQLPAEAQPNGKQLEAALTERKIPVRRQHFTVF